MANITRIKAKDPRAKAEPEPEKSGPKPVKAQPAKVTKPEKPKKTEKAAKTKTDKPKKPMSAPVRFITWPFRYLHESWLELRQVRWPSRGAAWKMVLAVLFYTALFILIIVLLDALFTLIFNQLLS